MFLTTVKNAGLQERSKNADLRKEEAPKGPKWDWRMAAYNLVLERRLRTKDRGDSRGQNVGCALGEEVDILNILGPRYGVESRDLAGKFGVRTSPTLLLPFVK